MLRRTRRANSPRRELSVPREALAQPRAPIALDAIQGGPPAAPVPEALCQRAQSEVRDEGGPDGELFLGRRRPAPLPLPGRGARRRRERAALPPDRQ